MKKWLVCFVLLVVLIFVVTFSFIPSPIVVNSVLKLPTSQKAMVRWLVAQDTWQKVLGVGKMEGYLILPNAIVTNIETIDLVKNGDTTKSDLFLLAFGKDSMAYSWGCTLPVTNNPINRVVQYLKAKEIKNIFDNTLANIKHLASEEKNISGLTVEHQIVIDTFFVAQKFSSLGYPTTEQIYHTINNLQNYLTEQKAPETGYPMLHVRKIDSTHYEAMAALPTNKILPQKGDIEFKRMVRGLILTTDVKGGAATIETTFAHFKNFVEDHGYTEIALPFQSLITDRLQQPDTTKWATKLYYPVY